MHALLAVHARAPAHRGVAAVLGRPVLVGHVQGDLPNVDHFSMAAPLVLLQRYCVHADDARALVAVCTLHLLPSLLRLLLLYVFISVQSVADQDRASSLRLVMSLVKKLA